MIKLIVEEYKQTLSTFERINKDNICTFKEEVDEVRMHADGRTKSILEEMRRENTALAQSIIQELQHDHEKMTAGIIAALENLAKRLEQSR